MCQPYTYAKCMKYGIFRHFQNEWFLASRDFLRRTVIVALLPKLVLAGSPKSTVKPRPWLGQKRSHSNIWEVYVQKPFVTLRQMRLALRTILIRYTETSADGREWKKLSKHEQIVYFSVHNMKDVACWIILRFLHDYMITASSDLRIYRTI
jgi:hypothetical protein